MRCQSRCLTRCNEVFQTLPDGRSSRQNSTSERCVTASRNSATDSQSAGSGFESLGAHVTNALVETTFPVAEIDGCRLADLRKVLIRVLMLPQVAGSGTPPGTPLGTPGSRRPQTPHGAACGSSAAGPVRKAATLAPRERPSHA